MAKTSTTRKVTKVARTGGGRTKRGQSSWIFPTFVVVVVVAGLAITAFSRQQRQPDTSHPRVGADHWHSAIGFDLCGTFAPPISDNGQDPLGIHTHGDGIVHTHPFSAQSAGKNAKLQVWFDTVGAKISATSIELPGGQPMKNGDKCGDQPGSVITKVWDTRAPDDKGHILTGKPGELHLSNNQLITIAFVPEGTDIPKPPSEPQLDRLGDVGPDTSSTTIPGDTTTSIAPTTTSPPTTAAP